MYPELANDLDELNNSIMRHNLWFVFERQMFKANSPGWKYSLERRKQKNSTK